MLAAALPTANVSAPDTRYRWATYRLFIAPMVTNATPVSDALHKKGSETGEEDANFLLFKPAAWPTHQPGDSVGRGRSALACDQLRRHP